MARRLDRRSLLRAILAAERPCVCRAFKQSLNCGSNSVSIARMYDPDDHKIIRKLLDLFGETECLSLGSLGRDDNATLYVTPKGLGYLLDVIAAALRSLPAAYAAAYDQGYTQAKDGF